jgi:hypothetical protein
VTVAQSGSGSPAQPFRYGVRLTPDGQNLIVVTEQGLAVYERVRAPDGTPLTLDDDGYVTLPAPVILGYDNNPIDPDDDGRVQLPPAAAPQYGTGLAIVSSKLVPDVIDGEAVGGWPLVDLSGTAFEGDPDASHLAPLIRTEDGLFALPEHTARRANGSGTIEPSQLTSVTGAGFSSNALPAVSITNPSPSRRMIVERKMLASVRISSPVGGACQVTLEQKINAGAFVGVTNRTWPVPTTGTQAIQADLEISKDLGQTIDPGETFSVQVRVFIQASAAIELFGVTV